MRVNVNRFQFICNLTRDADVQSTPGSPARGILDIAVMDTWCDNLGKGSKVYVEGRLENTEHTTVTSDRFTVSALCAVRYSRNPSPIVPQQCHAIEASARPSRNPSPIPLVIASREYRLPRAGRPAVRRFRSSFKRADDQKNQQANTEENRRSMKRPYRSSWIRPEVFIHSEREHV